MKLKFKKMDNNYISILLFFVLTSFSIRSTIGTIVYGSPSYHSTTRASVNSVQAPVVSTYTTVNSGEPASAPAAASPLAFRFAPSIVPPIQLTFETSLIGANSQQEHTKTQPKIQNSVPIVTQPVVTNTLLPPHTTYGASASVQAYSPSVLSAPTISRAPKTRSITSTIAAPTFVPQTVAAPALTSTIATRPIVTPTIAAPTLAAPTLVAPTIATRAIAPPAVSSLVTGYANYRNSYYGAPTNLAGIVSPVRRHATVNSLRAPISTYRNTYNLSPIMFYGASFTGNRYPYQHPFLYK